MFQDRPNMGFAILNIDIKKAFDTISYAYITMVLEALDPNFNNGYISTMM